MITPDAVVSYRIFDLTLTTVFALVRVAITLVVILFTIRIPFKRTFHWMFLVLSLGILYYSAIAAYAATAPDAVTYASRLAWIFLDSNRLLSLLIFQFVIYFVGPKPRRWMLYTAIAGYAYVAITNWVPLFVDPAFLLTKGFQSATGFVSGPGTSDAYLKPYGIDLYVAILAVPTFYLLVRYLRSEKTPLIRGQTKYLIIGLLIIIFSNYATNIARITGGPNFGNLIAGPGDLILLLGLLKKGFYSVTPVAETSVGPATILYPLEEARSYLARDTKASFEAFTSLVRTGHEGLSITRIFPDQVRKDYGIQTTPIRWLAETEGQDVISPGDLVGLSIMVKDFFEKAKKPVVMLQGVEYLTTINGFGPILRLIQGLSEENATKGGILILPVIPGSLNKQDEILLESETTPMPPPV